MQRRMKRIAQIMKEIGLIRMELKKGREKVPRKLNCSNRS
jgi:hypothetical protein